MSTVLITGCSRGLGLEAARQYLDDGWEVYATCRDPEQSNGLLELAGQYPQLHVMPLDIADNSSIENMVDALNGKPIDLLLQNAGVYGPRSSSLETVSADDWMKVLHVNAVAPLMLVQRLLDNLRASSAPMITLVSSKMGSMADNDSGGSYIYRSSKAALNSVGKSLAEDLKPEGIKVLLVHPGWVKTDMGGERALLTPTTSIAGIRQVIADFTPQESGTFVNYDGASIAW